MLSMSRSTTRPPLSIGIVTHDRLVSLRKLFTYLVPAITAYGARCEVVVANNRGEEDLEKINSILIDTGISKLCTCQIVVTKKNNISTGRNAILDNAREVHVVFIDDDEYPDVNWLVELVNTMERLNCHLVAGPIIPMFPGNTDKWVRHVDLHNIKGKITGDCIDYAASGNLLINRQGVEDVLFLEDLGSSGGEDTEFFLRMRDLGYFLYWSSESIVFEDIPYSRSSAAYMIKKFKSQGRIYRSILEMRDEIDRKIIFIIRSGLVTIVSLTIAWSLLYFFPSFAAAWMKRGYSNLGKFTKIDHDLYG